MLLVNLKRKRCGWCFWKMTIFLSNKRRKKKKVSKQDLSKKHNQTKFFSPNENEISLEIKNVGFFLVLRKHPHPLTNESFFPPTLKMKNVRP